MIRQVEVSGKSYREILEMQLAEFNRRVDCRKVGEELPDDLIIFAEHQPVYTLGKHGHQSNLLLSPEELGRNGIEYAEIGRGGDITYHGPGQITVYPILDLLRYRLGVKDYVDLLEETVVRTIGGYGIKGERIEGRTGVWIGKGTQSERKISAIGIKCSRHVSMHGFALNVGSDISRFTGIVPCGISNRGVTSISLEVGREVPVSEVKEELWVNITRLLRLRIPSPGNS